MKKTTISILLLLSFGTAFAETTCGREPLTCESGYPVDKTEGPRIVNGQVSGISYKWACKSENRIKATCSASFSATKGKCGQEPLTCSSGEPVNKTENPWIVNGQNVGTSYKWACKSSNRIETSCSASKGTANKVGAWDAAQRQRAGQQEPQNSTNIETNTPNAGSSLSIGTSKSCGQQPLTCSSGVPVDKIEEPWMVNGKPFGASYKWACKDGNGAKATCTALNGGASNWGEGASAQKTGQEKSRDSTSNEVAPIAANSQSTEKICGREPLTCESGYPVDKTEGPRIVNGQVSGISYKWACKSGNRIKATCSASFSATKGKCGQEPLTCSSGEPVNKTENPWVVNGQNVGTSYNWACKSSNRIETSCSALKGTPNNWGAWDAAQRQRAGQTSSVNKNSKVQINSQPTSVIK